MAEQSGNSGELVPLALGRIFRLLSRPERPGDVAEYEQCRKLILDAIVGEYVVPTTPYRPNWAADRTKGAQGD